MKNEQEFMSQEKIASQQFRQLCSQVLVTDNRQRTFTRCLSI
jgi:hypothetical protein